jgi:hypothetical protein
MGVCVGMLVGVLTAVGVPQADNTRTKQIIISNFKAFFIIMFLVRLNQIEMPMGKLIPAAIRRLTETSEEAVCQNVMGGVRIPLFINTDAAC